MLTAALERAKALTTERRSVIHPDVASVALLFAAFVTAQAPALNKPLADREVAVPSQYSDIRIRDEGPFRSMYFARPDGSMALESRVHKKEPSQLVVPYTKAMFASHLYAPKPKRALLVGLGGGSMVHFVRVFDPNLLVTAVDIDPAVVQSAAKYFGVTPSENIEIVTADAFDVLAKKAPKFDIIWMDAFLQPSEDTDENGVPLNIKTLAFWRQVKKRLTKQGVLVVNVNTGPSTKRDLATMKQAFGALFSVAPRGSGNLIVMAPIQTPDAKTLASRAKTLDERASQIGFADLARRAKPL